MTPPLLPRLAPPRWTPRNRCRDTRQRRSGHGGPRLGRNSTARGTPRPAHPPTHNRHQPTSGDAASVRTRPCRPLARRIRTVLAGPAAGVARHVERLRWGEMKGRSGGLSGPARHTSAHGLAPTAPPLSTATSRCQGRGVRRRGAGRLPREGGLPGHPPPPPGQGCFEGRAVLWARGVPSVGRHPSTQVASQRAAPPLRVTWPRPPPPQQPHGRGGRDVCGQSIGGACRRLGLETSPTGGGT